MSLSPHRRRSIYSVLREQVTLMTKNERKEAESVADPGKLTMQLLTAEQLTHSRYVLGVFRKLNEALSQRRLKKIQSP